MITVSKLDIARRQLETATRLYFDDGDEVSIHTLATAAYDVLDPLGCAAGIGKAATSEIVEMLGKAGHKKAAKEAADRFRNAQNFFKHSGKDGTATLAFDPKETELFLFEAIARYTQINKARSPILGAYHLWFLGHFPDAAVLPQKIKDLLKELPGLYRTNRRLFLQEYLASPAVRSSPPG